MANENMRIKVPELGLRPKGMEGWRVLWSEAEMVEVFNRYCDVKDRETKYRRESAARAKAALAYLKEAGVDVSAL